MDDFQSYLPEMLWEAGEQQGKTMEKFNEHEMRELLDGCLHKLHQSKLTQLDWDISAQTYRESISKLESVEQDIIQARDQEDRLSKLENGRSPNKRKHSNDDPARANKKQKRKCDICGKFHAGECQFKNKEGKKPFVKKQRFDNKFKKQLLTNSPGGRK